MLNKGRTWMSVMYKTSGYGHFLFPLPAGAWAGAVHGGHVKRQDCRLDYGAVCLHGCHGLRDMHDRTPLPPVSTPL